MFFVFLNVSATFTDQYQQILMSLQTLVPVHYVVRSTYSRYCMSLQTRTFFCSPLDAKLYKQQIFLSFILHILHTVDIFCLYRHPIAMSGLQTLLIVDIICYYRPFPSCSGNICFIYSRYCLSLQTHDDIHAAMHLYLQQILYVIIDIPLFPKKNRTLLMVDIVCHYRRRDSGRNLGALLIVDILSLYRPGNGPYNHYGHLYKQQVFFVLIDDVLHRIDYNLAAMLATYRRDQRRDTPPLQQQELYLSYRRCSSCVRVFHAYIRRNLCSLIDFCVRDKIREQST